MPTNRDRLLHKKKQLDRNIAHCKSEIEYNESILSNDDFSESRKSEATKAIERQKERIDEYQVELKHIETLLN